MSDEPKSPPDISDFGLQPKHECQVGCPVLKQLYDDFKRHADNFWKDVDAGGFATEAALASVRARAAAYSDICTSIGVAINPKAAAWLLQSMMGEDE